MPLATTGFRPAKREGTQQAVQFRFQPAGGSPQSSQRDLLRRITVPQGQPFFQQLLDGQRKTGRRRCRHFRQIPAAVDQVRHTALMRR
jgi:hypothetical protein